MEGIVSDNFVVLYAGQMVTVVHNNQGVHRDSEGVEEQVCEIPTKEFDLSRTESELEVDAEEGVWGRSGVNAETYKRKMVI